MKRFSISILIFLIVLQIGAQNLVPNSSFEAANRSPGKEGNSINRARDWMAPIGLGDYYMKGTGRHSGVPKNIFGKQPAHTGIAYAGICIRTKFLEYLEAKLTDTLKSGQEYLVEFYISRAELSIGSVSEFGVLFTSKKIWGLTGVGISATPQVIIRGKKKYKDKKKWTKLSAVYTAEGDETVIILGHFLNPATKKRKMFCHYYIDDVSVTAINRRDSITSPMEKNLTQQQASLKVNETIVLRNVFFESGESELLPESFSSLDSLIYYLNQESSNNIKISGHTDNIGNETKNLELSKARAKAIAEYLIMRGIGDNRISYVGFGSTKPVESNDSEEGRKKNRRVEFFLFED